METITNNEKPVPLRTVALLTANAMQNLVMLDRIAGYRNKTIVSDLADQLLDAAMREPTEGTGLNQQEPAPLPSDGPAVWDLVKEDINERDRLGTAKYGQRLTVGDGRRSLVDAYQEALDLAVYLRKAVAEDPPPTEDPELRDTMLDYKRRLENLTTLCERRGLRVGWGERGEVTLEESR